MSIRASDLMYLEVQVLLRHQDVVVEVLLQTLVAQVDAELFERVVLEDFKPKHVQGSDPKHTVPEILCR